MRSQPPYRIRVGCEAVARFSGLDFLTRFLTVDPMKATVTSKGQITIPLPLRRKLHLQTGTVLEFDGQADCLKATKAVDPERMRTVIGIAKKELAPLTTLQWLDNLRGPVELPVPRQAK